MTCETWPHLIMKGKALGIQVPMMVFNDEIRYCWHYPPLFKQNTPNRRAQLKSSNLC